MEINLVYIHVNNFTYLAIATTRPCLTTGPLQTAFFLCLFSVLEILWGGGGGWVNHKHLNVIQNENEKQHHFKSQLLTTGALIVMKFSSILHSDERVCRVQNSFV